MRIRDNGFRRERRGGFSLMIVMVAIMFVAGGISAMTVMFRTDAKRTRAALATPQLRQLLLAGVAAGQSELATHGTEKREVVVPTPVESATLRLEIAPEGGSVPAATMRVVAEWKGFRARETVHLTRQGYAVNPWRVDEATLLQVPIQ